MTLQETEKQNRVTVQKKNNQMVGVKKSDERGCLQGSREKIKKQILCRNTFEFPVDHCHAVERSQCKYLGALAETRAKERETKTRAILSRHVNKRQTLILYTSIIIMFSDYVIIKLQHSTEKLL